jgi:hypothetical protein
MRHSRNDQLRVFLRWYEQFCTPEGQAVRVRHAACDATDPTLEDAYTLIKPDAQCAVGLVTNLGPGKFDPPC